jgi:aminoglycoside phosphotransferase
MATRHIVAPSHAEQLSWATAALESLCGGPVRVVEGEAGRVAQVWRLESGNPPRTYFLKQYGKHLTRDAFEAHVAYVTQLMTAMRAAGCVASEVVGSSPELRLLLLTAVPGRTLMAMRRRAWRTGGVRRLTEAWRGVGEWLRTLHDRTLPSQSSADRRDGWDAYAASRLRKWAEIDVTAIDVSARATVTVAALAETMPASIQVTPCHGDVSTGNILVGEHVGLIDFDDARPDLPATDLTQALVHIDEFGYVGGLLRVPALAGRCTDALLDGYGAARLSGADFWVPYFESLSVFALALARQRAAASGVGRLGVDAQYARACGRIFTALGVLDRSGADASYLLIARMNKRPAR